MNQFGGNSVEIMNEDGLKQFGGISAEEQRSRLPLPNVGRRHHEGMMSLKGGEVQRADTQSQHS